MSSKNSVGRDKQIEIARSEFSSRFLDRPIRRRITLFLLRDAESREHAQPIRIEREHRLRPAQKQNLINSGVAYRRKSLQQLAAAFRLFSQNLRNVAAELVQDQSCRLAHPSRAEFRINAALRGSSDERGVRRSRDFAWGQTDATTQRVERGAAAIVSREIRDVLVQNQREGIAYF